MLLLKPALKTSPVGLLLPVLSLVITTSCGPELNAQTTIAQQDFDGGTPEWSYHSNHNFFSNTSSNTSKNIYDSESGWGDHGFYGVVSNSTWGSDLNFSNLSGEIFGVNDLDDGGDFGTENTAKLTFESRNISGYNSVEITFDYDLNGSWNNDFLRYQVFEDGVGQGVKTIASNTSKDGNKTITSISNSTDKVKLVLRIDQDSQSDYGGIDNVKLKGTAKSQSQPSSQPSNFTANALSNGKIELTWTDASGPDGYLIKATDQGSSSISAPSTGNDPNLDKTYQTVVLW
jgi:hypothetical protein